MPADSIHGPDTRARIAEVRLRESQRVAQIGSWELDLRRNVLWWSDEVFRIFGVDQASFEPSYHAFLSRIHHDDRDMVDCTFRDSVRNRAPYNVVHRIVHTSGEVKFVRERGESEFDADGLPVRSVGTVQDITGPWLDRQALLESEERYRTFTRLLPDAVVVYRKSGEILIANEAAARLAGVAVPDDLVGRKVEEFVAPTHRDVAQQRRRLLFEANRAADPVTLHLTRQDGTEVVVESRGSSLTLAGETVALLVIRDVTERHELQEQLHQARKMDAIGRLAGGVAHDFNNLLSVILGYTEMAMGTVNEASPLASSLTQVHKAAVRASRLTGQLLAFSRKQVLELRTLDLNEVVRDLERTLLRLIGEHIELRAHLSPDLHMVRADRSQMEQVLLNLAINARDAMPSGGSVTVLTANSGGHVRLSVIDTGGGIPEDIRARVFEPFFTTKRRGEGTGLGLATVYGIVTQSGGSIDVRCPASGGTEFEILLPRAPEDDSADPRPTV